MRIHLLRLVCVCWSIVGLGASSAVAQDDATSTPFEPPFRIQANEMVIDTGAAWGHSSPCVVDLDQDGLEDLIVGDFGGKFRKYRNVGSAESPRYKENGFLQAGSVDAEVNIYCCIGSQARFCDLDADGVLDMIANSYDPGHCYLFRGLPGGKFAAREEMLDKAGVPIRSFPDQKQNYQSFGSFYETVDWDDDGDLDLLIGCFDGKLKRRMNEGSESQPEFAEKNIPVEAEGEPLQVEAHLCPVVADWDGDGRWDIVAGSDDGSVTLFLNQGTRTSPSFAAGQTLVQAADGNGYNLMLWPDSEVVPGIRSQVDVTDYNGDGKLDLLVGDFYTAYEFKEDLSAREREQAEKLVTENDSLGKAFADKLKALRDDFQQRYPGDKVYSDEANAAWSKEYQALRDSPVAKDMEANEKEFVKQLRPFLASTQGEGDRSFDLALSHGHVWMFLRK